MQCFAKTLNESILDVRVGSECDSEYLLIFQIWILNALPTRQKIVFLEDKFEIIMRSQYYKIFIFRPYSGNSRIRTKENIINHSRLRAQY